MSPRAPGHAKGSQEQQQPGAPQAAEDGDAGVPGAGQATQLMLMEGSLPAFQTQF